MYSGAPLHDKRLWCFLSVILPDCPRAQRVWDYCREKTSEMTFCSLFSPCLSCCLSPHTDTAGSMSDMLLYCWQLLLSVCSSASVSVALMVYKGLMKAVLLFIALVHLPSCCLIVRQVWLAGKHSLCSIQFMNKCFHPYQNGSFTCTCVTWVHFSPGNHLWSISTFNIRDSDSFPQVLFIWLTSTFEKVMWDIMLFTQISWEI